jgi:hypothetical protein
MKQNSEIAVKSATRAVDILEFVAAASSPPTFRELAAGLSIPNSSLFYVTASPEFAYLRMQVSAREAKPCYFRRLWWEATRSPIG